MSADTLLSRLEKTRRTGSGTWLACCPAHADKSPSMTVRELEDGRVLLHCFAGCDVGAVLGALGLEFGDLYPPNPVAQARPLRRPFPAADVLEVLMHDALTLQQIAVELQDVCRPSHAPMLRGIASRVSAAMGMVNG